MAQAVQTSAIPGLLPGRKALLVFFETDCPTCQLALPYLNNLGNGSAQVIGLSQDNEASTREFVRQLN
ncbi:MAG TPA: redoxin family protein, partial [Candidatus Angelobacter sp.]|nr:redoxin family protein [Candidatus Angelobacter sp.]